MPLFNDLLQDNPLRSLPEEFGVWSRFLEGCRQYEAEFWSEAFKCWIGFAEEGIAEAQVNIGYLHYRGHGAEESYDLAVKWWGRAMPALQQAAHNDCANAQYQLYHLLSQVETETRYIRARQLWWLRSAARLGHQEAMLTLGYSVNLCYGHPYQAALWIGRAAAAGWPEAHYRMGNFYNAGVGVPFSREKAIHHYWCAASQGDISARRRLHAFAKEKNCEAGL